MKKIDKPAKVLDATKSPTVILEATNIGSHKPSKDVLNYYVYYWGWDKALEVFNLTPKQAEKILFDLSFGGKKIGVHYIKEPYHLQGNRDPIINDTKAMHDTVEVDSIEYRSISV